MVISLGRVTCLYVINTVKMISDIEERERCAKVKQKYIFVYVTHSKGVFTFAYELSSLRRVEF